MSLIVGITLEEKMFIWTTSHMSSGCWNLGNRTFGVLGVFRQYLMRLMDLERTLKGGRETKNRERERRGWK